MMAGTEDHEAIPPCACATVTRHLHGIICRKKTFSLRYLIIINYNVHFSKERTPFVRHYKVFKPACLSDPAGVFRVLQSAVLRIFNGA